MHTHPIQPSTLIKVLHNEFDFTYSTELDGILINGFTIVSRNFPRKLIATWVWWHDNTLFFSVCQNTRLFWGGSLRHGEMFLGRPIPKPNIILSSKLEVVCCLWLQPFQDVRRICTKTIKSVGRLSFQHI